MTWRLLRDRTALVWMLGVAFAGMLWFGRHRVPAKNVTKVLLP